MHIEWQQFGNTIFVEGSKQIPHSSSLSKSPLESFPSPWILLLLELSDLACFSLALSNSSTFAWSRWRDGNMTAEVGSSLQTKSQLKSCNINTVKLHLDFKKYHNKPTLMISYKRHGDGNSRKASSVFRTKIQWRPLQITIQLLKLPIVRCVYSTTHVLLPIIMDLCEVFLTALKPWQFFPYGTRELIW